MATLPFPPRSPQSQSSYGSPAVGRSAVDNPGGDRAAGDKASLEKSTLDKSALEKLGLEKSNPDKAGPDKTGLDQTGLGQAGLDQAGLGQAGLDSMALDKMALDKMTLDKTGLEKVGPGTGAIDQTPVVALKELVARLNREQSKTQDLLSSLGFALRSFTNLNQFLELIPMVASRVTNADGGALILFHSDGQPQLDKLLCSNPAYGARIQHAVDEVSQQLAQLDRGRVNWNALATVLDDRVGRSLGMGIQLFGTSVLNRSVERGRLYVFSHSPVYQWTESRQKLVRFVADQTAVAIEHDELSSELRQKERLDRELEIGAEIQRQLLPRQCPRIVGLELAARCQTANRVGGDYYDFIPTRAEGLSGRRREGSDRDRWAITIGDVMGKGVPAGLIMTMLRGMLRAEVLNGHSPARILQHLNYVMYTDLENSNRFVTLFYSEYDPKTRILSYSNAAHNPPLLWRAATQTLHRLDTLGMLIGLHDNSQYDDGQVQLNPGDVVIYYTDGFTDAANATGDRFDEDNLVRAIQQSCQRDSSPQEILDALFERLQRFIGPGKRNGDDMTLIVMKSKHAPEPLPGVA